MPRELRDARGAVARLGTFLRAARFLDDDDNLTDERVLSDEDVAVTLAQLDGFRAEQHERARKLSIARKQPRLPPTDPRVQEVAMLAIAGASYMLSTDKAIYLARAVPDFKFRHAVANALGWATFLDPAYPATETLDSGSRLRP